ncbi:endomucin isoform X1 [Trachypithecus francoisi]|uniref:endomucin isoform X1 n=1 Tax=Trachypithecus francoisi TaxID=54180 RepID=UPI00141B7AC7|nr:endomucin isoform X1 [Trachypithecus francoisi]XP_033034257.1 endomucin isoform X1 [Trachypithecus francoisi]
MTNGEKISFNRLYSCFLLNIVGYGGVINATTPSSVVVTTTKTSVTTPNTGSSQKDVITTIETTPKGTITSELLKTSLMTTVTLLITSKDEGLRVTTPDVRENKSIISNITVTSVTPPNAVSTLQSSKPKTETQSSIKTTKIPGSTLQPDSSPSKTGTVSSIPVTIPENTSQSQVIGTEGGKNASTSATSRSYSSVILPVVIALIVITLSVFVLVGLYRMCWKADPGTPENGNDQPQSDKESVKLLTVKTISHESGEHSAQGKTKN